MTDEYYHRYRDASSSIAALDQKVAMYREIVELWLVVSRVLVEHPTHHKKCTAGLDIRKPVECDRCKCIAMLDEVIRISNAIL